MHMTWNFTRRHDRVDTFRSDKILWRTVRNLSANGDGKSAKFMHTSTHEPVRICLQSQHREEEQRIHEIALHWMNVNERSGNGVEVWGEKKWKGGGAQVVMPWTMTLYTKFAPVCLLEVEVFFRQSIFEALKSPNQPVFRRRNQYGLWMTSRRIYIET